MNYCPPGTFLYAVRFGDTLWQLASYYNTTVQDIINLNPGIDPDNLVVGQELCLPLIVDEIDEYEEIEPVLALNNELRMLWEQHIFWTHRMFMSIVFGLPDREAVMQRLLRNPEDFAEVFTDYYGSD
ncbi:MAG: LysM domain-containing protein, partial [Bacilli bacterium]|nr:LysM domain-containing protein [Bacilli bacterium]